MEKPGAVLCAVLKKGLEDGCYPSACAAVGQGGTVLGECCVGEAPVPGEQPVDRHTRYDMASVSKILGPTMLALQALERGDLALGSRIGAFFDVPCDKRAITVLMLMTHTAGFLPSFRLDRLGISPDQAVQAILESPLQYTPGI